MASTAGGAKNDVGGVEQHLTDFNFMEVKIRLLGRIQRLSSPSVARVSLSCLRSSATCASRTLRLPAMNLPNFGRRTLTQDTRDSFLSVFSSEISHSPWREVIVVS